MGSRMTICRNTTQRCWVFRATKRIAPCVTTSGPISSPSPLSAMRRRSNPASPRSTSVPSRCIPLTNENEKPGLVERRPVHKGRIVDLSIDRVRFPNGKIGELEMIRHSGASAVLPVLSDMEGEDPQILLVRQYRYASGG